MKKNSIIKLGDVYVYMDNNNYFIINWRIYDK